MPLSGDTLGGAAANPKVLWCQRWDLVSGFLELKAFHLARQHLEILMISGAEHTPRFATVLGQEPWGAGQPGDAESLPGRQQGAGDPCQPRGPSGTLRRGLAIPTLQQPAWQAAGDSASLGALGAHLPAWQVLGSRGAQHQQGGAGRQESILQATARSLSKLGRGWRAPTTLSLSHISGNQRREEPPLPIRKSQFSRL